MSVDQTDDEQEDSPDGVTVLCHGASQATVDAVRDELETTRVQIAEVRADE